ncbi:MAG: PAH dioxygenase [Piscirickettsiaceae bacterium]|nr:MAG: PAH dioxygenase [Piscirickettsiaceae bacterium]PCI65616.1 MAG: PAH dioxygenase [Piscirickettsiaceae bacterium]
MNTQQKQQVEGRAVDHLTHFEIERFLIGEARALDEERYHEWLDKMITKDIIYQLPTEEVRYRRDKKVIGTAQTTYLYNDSYEVLAMRVARFDTGFLWAEDPPIRIRRYITNIDAMWSDTADEVDVWSNFMVYRSRGQRDDSIMYGRRKDRLRKVEGSWRLAARVITLDQRVILDKNVHCFF